MPNKTNTLTIHSKDGNQKHEFTSPSCYYDDIYEEDFTVTPSDTLQVLANFDTTAPDSTTTHNGYKSLVVQNTGKTGVELQITHNSFTHSATDAGAAFTNMILAKDEFLHLHTNFVNYDTSVTSAANAVTQNDLVNQNGFSSSGETVAEDLDATETGITTSSNGALRFRVGDYILVDVLDPDSANNGEAMRVEDVVDANTLKVERGVLGTTAQTHATGVTIYWVTANLFAPWNRPIAISQGTTYAAVNSNPDTITDSGNGLLTDGHLPNMITKFEQQGASPDSGYIVSASDGTLTLTTQNSLTAQGAGTETMLMSAFITTTIGGGYHSKNLFGIYSGRVNSTGAEGIVPGSVRIKFAIPPYCQLANSQSRSPGLTVGTQYRFDLNIDGVLDTIEFTLDSDTWDDFIVKVQSAIETKVAGTGSYGIGCDVVRGGVYGFNDGEIEEDNYGGPYPIVLRGRTRIVTAGATTAPSVSRVNVSAATSGSGTQLLGANENFGDYGTFNTNSKFPSDTRINDSGVTEEVTKYSLYDSGGGQLLPADDNPFPNAQGLIYYDRGEVILTGCPGMAEMILDVSSSSALSGKQSTESTRANSVTSISARSVNSTADGKVKVVILK